MISSCNDCILKTKPNKHGTSHLKVGSREKMYTDLTSIPKSKMTVYVKTSYLSKDDDDILERSKVGSIVSHESRPIKFHVNHIIKFKISKTIMAM